ncbi:hypothetical protein [Breoghania sp.]|uniref:hypothetical protein n=1 Tax=Breoghania sp. TaxID=2065378 RepID=UPI002AAB081E|nr:hypothetical protein [Breoghania sp.]
MTYYEKFDGPVMNGGRDPWFKRRRPSKIWTSRAGLVAGLIAASILTAAAFAFLVSGPIWD